MHQRQEEHIHIHIVLKMKSQLSNAYIFLQKAMINFLVLSQRFGISSPSTA